MNLRHLSVFHGVARAGSVNAAARLLHTSQPAVSRELRTLEERLGVPLFDRLPRGMRLTEAGQLLLGYAERIFGQQAALEGGGIGWTSELCVLEELRSGRLVELKIPRLSLERPLYTLRLRGRHLKRSALAFLHSLEQPKA